MKTIRDFVSVMTFHTLLVSVLAVGATYLCQTMDWEAEIPTGLIGLAVVFPIVFSINAAYRRREESLRYYGDLKAHGIALYFAHRDWVPDPDGQESSLAAQCRENFQRLLKAISVHFLEDGGRNDKTFAAIYQVFSDYSALNEKMRDANVPANEVSRANQFVSKMMINFEKMRNILDYRTPVSLRSYSRVFLSIFPILFGPYFAHLSNESYPAVGYGVAIIYSLVLVTLDNIQEDLEDPFDQIGTDDIKLDVFKDYESLVKEDQ